MRVGILCEFSGRVRDAFIRHGHEAISCDILPTETPGPHLQGNCRAFDWSGYDLLICHPPCTYLANSGVRWLKTQPGRWEAMEEAVELFRWMLALPCPRIAVENPIIHCHARERIGRPQDQIIHPWQFGHGESKATCLWLKDLPKLTPTAIVDGREGRVLALPPSPDRVKLRSLTYPGIAEAMAVQWGCLS
jgi:hypothetical protein